MLTASCLHGRVNTAESCLGWFQEKIERTSLVWSALPLLMSGVVLLESVIRKIKKEGPENIDPSDVRAIGMLLKEASESVRRLLGHSDAANVSGQLPFRAFLPLMKRQGGTLSELASQCFELHDRWHDKIQMIGKERILRAKEIVFSASSLDFSDELEHGLSDHELEAHLHHTITHKK